MTLGSLPPDSTFHAKIEIVLVSSVFSDTAGCSMSGATGCSTLGIDLHAGSQPTSDKKIRIHPPNFHMNLFL